MSLYVPSAIQAADLDVAIAPYLGGEFAVYLTTKAAVKFQEIALTAAGEGDSIAVPGASFTAPGHIQIAALTPILSSAAVEFEFNSGQTIGGADTPATATFAPPARAANQSFNFARGYAVDLLAETPNPGDTFTSLDLISSSGIDGGGKNQVFGVFQLPAFSDYSLVGCTTDIDFNTKSRAAKGVDCGMEADAYIKRGKTQPGELNIGGKLKGFAEGLARFDGLKTTVMLVGLKDGQVTGDRLVFTQWVPNLKPRLPDGDGEAMIDATGKFSEHLFFVAP